MGKLKCLGPCGREFDVTDRAKAFGRPSALNAHICIDCREEIKREKAESKESIFNQTVAKREMLSNAQRKTVIKARASRFMEATDALAVKLQKKADDDWIGL